MKSKILSISLAFCIMTLLLSACNGSSIEDKIPGSWAPAGESEYITFNSDGTVYLGEDIYGDSIYGTWTVTDDNVLEIIEDEELMSITVTDISSDSMTWETGNGNTITLLKH